jgi:ParB-like nuclease domain
VHVDPVGSEETSPSGVTDFGSEATLGRADEPPPPAGRESLPKRFRMRHGRHYVDEVLGDTPPRTVRQIPVSEIEPPPDEGICLDALEESIRTFGIIEPLVVARIGPEYRVVAGLRRLRAARTIGLSTVPCVVADVDLQRFADMRAAVSDRSIPAPTVVGEPIDPPVDQPTRAGQENGLLRVVLADVEAVELLRAKTASWAADMLTRPMLIDRAPATVDESIDEAVAAVTVEARLRAVRLVFVGMGTQCRIAIDAARVRSALTGLLQSMLSLAPHGGSVLSIRAQVTTIRPALIVECRLADARYGNDDSAQARPPIWTDAQVARLFDPEWQEHPCGAAGAQMLGALAKVTRAHGGRVQAQIDGTITFVVPRPLTDI